MRLRYRGLRLQKNCQNASWCNLALIFCFHTTSNDMGLFSITVSPSKINRFANKRPIRFCSSSRTSLTSPLNDLPGLVGFLPVVSRHKPAFSPAGTPDFRYIAFFSKAENLHFPITVRHAALRRFFMNHVVVVIMLQLPHSALNYPVSAGQTSCELISSAFLVTGSKIGTTQGHPVNLSRLQVAGYARPVLCLDQVRALLWMMRSVHINPIANTLYWLVWYPVFRSVSTVSWSTELVFLQPISICWLVYSAWPDNSVKAIRNSVWGQACCCRESVLVAWLASDIALIAIVILQGIERRNTNGIVVLDLSNAGYRQPKLKSSCDFARSAFNAFT